MSTPTKAPAVGGKAPAGVVKTPARYLPDGSIDPSAPGDLFDDVLDEWHSTQARPTGRPDAASADDLHKNEQLFLHEFARALGDNLAPQGFKRFRVTPDRPKREYVVKVLDSEGREYTARLTFRQLAELSHVYPVDFARRLFKEVTEAILQGRRTYFARMGRA